MSCGLKWHSACALRVIGGVAAGEVESLLADPERPAVGERADLA